MSLRILCILIVAVIGTQAFPQQRRPSDSESPDFNFDGKPAEKTHRSLDTVQYQDGVNRGRSTFKDSYGNPVAYDSLDDVDAQKPSKNKDNPLNYVIPGYASGILQAHEIPARSATVEDDTGRRINDDRIHFVDPLSPNQYQTGDKRVPPTPSTSLSAPGIINENSQIPIEIPRPNIDLQETPETPTIDDPIDHVPQNPPKDVFLNSPPASILEVPINQDANTRPLFHDLVPPQIPTSGIGGVEIPRPNLDINETPIDNDNNNPLNTGLLPPPTSSDQQQPTTNNNFNSQPQQPNNKISFGNPNSNAPEIITDDQTVFAPKPSNGLLPPKQPIGNDIDFQAQPLPSSPSTPQFTNSITNIPRPGPSQQSFQIPVHVIQTPSGRPNFIQKPSIGSKIVNKYQGTFGGSAGVLTPPSGGLVAPTQVPLLPLAPSTTDKFSGTFGGADGVLGSDTNSRDNLPPLATFGGAEGVLNSANNNNNNLNPATQTFGGAEGVLNSPDGNLNSNNDNNNPQTFGGSEGILNSGGNGINRNNLVPQTFGGPEGVLSSSDSNNSNLNFLPAASTTTQTFTVPITNPNNNKPLPPKTVANKYGGKFGGSPGILSPSI